MLDEALKLTRAQPFTFATSANFDLHAVVVNRTEHGATSWTFHKSPLCHACVEKSRINQTPVLAGYRKTFLVDDGSVEVPRSSVNLNQNHYGNEMSMR